MDTEYQPPYYAQKKILHENPSLSQPAVSQSDKEEATRRILKTKINRYPLRQYKNLGAGLDVHSRPNYYESDQEEEDSRRRRHSIATFAQEEEEAKRSNLKIIRRRRFSEGTTLWERKRAIEGADVEEAGSNLHNDGLDNDESDSESEDLCITRTLTYTSKKQVIKLYKTEHLDINAPQNKAVFKRLCDLASKDGQLKNRLPNCKNKKDDRSEKQPINPNRTDLPSSVQYDNRDDIEKEMENIHRSPQARGEDTVVQDSEEENKACSKSNEKSYFLAQLKLKSLQCGDMEENACNGASNNEGIGEKSSILPPEVRLPEMKDKVTQTEDCYQKITSSSDKRRKYIKKGKLNESKTPSKSSVKKLSPHSKSLKKGNKKKTPGKTDATKNVSGKAKLIKDSCKNLELSNNRSKPNVDKTSNGKSDGSKKEKTQLSQNKPPEYHEVLKMACENMLKPDTAIKKNTVSTNTSNESKTKVTKGNKQSAGCSGFEKINKTETVSKEKMRNGVTKEHEQSAGCSGSKKMNQTETAIKEKTEKSETPKDLISCEEKEKKTKISVENIQPPYNMEDLESKLQSLFEEPENQNLAGGSSIETIPMKTAQQNQNDSTNKPKTTRINQNDSTNKPKTTHLNQTDSTDKPKTTRINQTDSTNKPKTTHLNQTDSTNKPKTARLNQNESTNKPSQHLDLHKVKDKINKTPKKPTNPKPRRHSPKPDKKNKYSDRPTFGRNSSSDKIGAKITMRMIEQLQEKRRALCETKSMLEKMLWPDRHEKSASSTISSTEQKTKERGSVPEEKQKIEEPSKENVIEKGNDQLDEGSSSRITVDSKEAEPNELRGEELLVNSEIQIEFEETEREENIGVSTDSNKSDGRSIEIVERCCCCSPIATPEVLPNENSNSDNRNLNSNTEELDNLLKIPEESGRSDSNADDRNGGTCTGTSLEDTFQNESEEDEDRRRLIAALTDSVDILPSPLNCREVEIESESIANNSDAKKPASDVQVKTAGMEHYKKRLIHQHEKPGPQISPYATAEEDDDSWESPLSPASSNVCRDSGQQDRRKEDVVQKVARKRAVCRSQFRHQNLELFKLGHSIPTSLCKTKEPYNVCAEKNLQMCYQNGGSKKCDKNPAKGSLTESIINTMDGSKKKEVPLWRSVSLNNELSERQIAPLSNNEGDSKNSGNGRHVLPAIVPELPERRKNRIKSLPESSVRSTRDNAEAENSKGSNEGHTRSVYDFTEENEEVAAEKNKPVEAISKKPVVRQKSREESNEPQAQDIVEAHTRNSDSASTIRRQSTSSESDVLDCVPINLSMKNKDANGRHPTWTDVFSAHHAKRNESNYNQHLLAYGIPKQPSNVPKKPAHPPEGIVPRNRLEENLARTISENLDAGRLDKDGNCFFVTSIPGNALDPQKQSNVIVINFPHMQQQMARMEKPSVAPPNVPEPQHSQMEMLDSAIMSLVNIVKSSVESVFNIMSLPVLNRLYIDLSHYLLLPAVSIKMKLCIDDALNLIVSYVLVNMFRVPINSKIRDFVHKLMQLDLRPHMDFIVNSIDVIRQKIKYDYFTDHLLKVFSRNPNEDFQPLPPPRNARRPVADHPNVRALMPPPPQQIFPGHNQPVDFRDCYSRPWAENPPYQHGNPMMANADLMGGVPQSQPQKRGRRQHQEADRHLLASMRMPENFNEPNLAMMRPDLYLADNRCIPPNIGHMHPEALTNQARAPKGRPRNLNKPNKPPNKLSDNTLDLSLLSQRAMLEQNQLFNYREKNSVNVPNSNVLAFGKTMHRNGDIATHRDMMEENLQFRNRPRLMEERRLSDGALVPNNITGNGGNFFNGNHPLPIITNYDIRNDSDRRSNAGIFSKDRLMQTLETVINDGNNVKVTHNTTPMNEIQRYPGAEPKNVSRNNPELPSGARQAIIVSNEIVHHKKQIEPNAKVTTKNTRDNRGAVAKQCPVSDVEQFLQTNIIVNKHQPTSAARGSVLENVTPTKNIHDPSKVAVCEEKGDQRIIEKVVNEYRFDKDSVQSDTDTEKTNVLPTAVANSGTDSNTIESNVCSDREREESRLLQSQEVIEANDSPEVVSSTVIIKDKSMEISKGDTSLSDNVGVPGIVNNQMDLDDVILERVSLNGELRNGISYTSGWNEGSKPSGRPREMEKDIGRESSKERLRIVADVSIEKVTDNFDAPPKLIKLTTLKRKVVQEEKQQRKRVKRWPVQGEINDEIVIIEDDDKGKEQLDYNQNNVGEGDKSKEVSEKNVKNDSREKTATASEPQADAVGKKDTSKTPKQAKAKSAPPLIEDISSDEEVLPPFRLYSTYENKVNGDPRKILQTTEVSEITLMDDNVAVIQKANRHLFEKPPVYTRPVMPRKLRKSLADGSSSWSEPLAKMVQFSEDPGGLTCSLKVKNSELKYPSNVDVRRYSPVVSYQHASPTRSPHFSPTFKSPPRPVHASPGVVQTSPGVRRSPVMPMSPTVSGSPKAQTVTRLPIDQTSPVVVQSSPIGLTSPHLNESDVNWRHWFAEEERNGVFNFERSQSLESNTLSGQSVEASSSVGSDYSPKFPSEEPICEIKIDSKPYRIKKSLLEKIPKGKLCYVRETNTFIRYFDDKQMELFINNLNLGEGSTVASDLLKQVRGRAEGPSDVETPPVQSDKSEKGEVITLSKDVVFSTEDFLSDPELYVEEVEKVQRYVPKDFYGFYKFVTGYQIINHHPPISFQTFLTMHNTNGIRGLFKNYVNALVEGRNIL